MFNQLARIFFLGAALESVWIGVRAVAPLRSHSGAFVLLASGAFVLLLIGYFSIPVRDNRSALVIVLFGLLFRLTLLPAHPDQSEDVYRYLWDARVYSSGINPLRFPPEAPELAHLRDDRIYPRLNSRAYVSVYPPVSQYLFRTVYELFGENVTAMKAVFSLLEFGALLLAWKLLIAFGSDLRPLVLLAWNPLFIFEFSHSGHSDSAMMFLLLLSVYLLHRSKRAWAMIGCTGAVLVKLHPALLFPLFARKSGWKGTLAGIGAGAALILPFVAYDAWREYVKSLLLYFRLFEFNAGIHYALRYFGRAVYSESWDKLTGPYLGAALLLIVALIIRKFPIRNARDLLHAAFWIMTADLCLATTVHPWYLSWAALALPFFPYAFMIYWTGAALLSYLAYGYQPVYEPAWVLLVEYAPVYVLMAWEIIRGGPLTAVRSSLKTQPVRPMEPLQAFPEGKVGGTVSGHRIGD